MAAILRDGAILAADDAADDDAAAVWRWRRRARRWRRASAAAGLTGVIQVDPYLPEVVLRDRAKGERRGHGHREDLKEELGRILKGRAAVWV